jgi:predicted nucleic acid-binding protein
LKRKLKQDREPKEPHYVDSNVFFYAKTVDAEFGASCAEVVRAIHGGRIQAATSVLVTLEVANALRKYGLAKEVNDTTDSIFSLGIEVFDLESSDIRNATTIFQRYHISPYDCAHAAVMKRTGIKNIISADKDFDLIREISRKDPKTFM